jgi:hypothetical protein
MRWAFSEFLPNSGRGFPNWIAKKTAPLFAKGAVSFFVEEPVSLKKLKN